MAPVANELVYTSDAEWDDSSQTYSFFVSTPAFQDGRIIGVLIAGLDISDQFMEDMSLEDLTNIDISTIDLAMVP